MIMTIDTQEMIDNYWICDHRDYSVLDIFRREEDQTSSITTTNLLENSTT